VQRGARDARHGCLLGLIARREEEGEATELRLSVLPALFDERRGIVHASGFILRTDATLTLAVYSTGAIARLVAADCLGLVDFYAKKQ